MKNILILLLLSAAPSWASSYPALEHANALEGSWQCSDGVHVYGQTSVLRTVVSRRENAESPPEDRGDVASLNANFRIRRLWGTSTPDLIFAEVYLNDSNVFHLLRSSDGALTFIDVFTFGAGNGGSGKDSANVRLLNGFLEVTVPYPGGGGVGDLYIGEYNVNSSRTAGGTNDRVRIMKSTDHGASWHQVTLWNGSGHQLEHIHAIKQDPFTGYLYLCTGDSNAGAGIIRWDGAASWPANTSIAHLDPAGFQVLSGAQRYRSTDILFDANFAYIMADCPTNWDASPAGDEHGIWKMAKDLSSYVRVNNDLFQVDPMHFGWFGQVLNGVLSFLSAVPNPVGTHAWKDPDLRIFTSYDGDHWHAVAQGRGRATVATGAAFAQAYFQHGGKLWLADYGMAGYDGTDILELNGDFNDTESSYVPGQGYQDTQARPVIVHPVYYAGTWDVAGSDANLGRGKNSPTATLNRLLASNHIVQGARVRVAAGNFPERNIYPIWNQPEAGSLYQGSGPVLIEGQGPDLTHVFRPGGNVDYLLFLTADRTLSSPATPIIFSGLHLYNIGDGLGRTIDELVLQVRDGVGVELRNCKIGGDTNYRASLIAVGSNASLKASQSIFAGNPGDTLHTQLISAQGTNALIAIDRSIFLNGVYSVHVDGADTKLAVVNSVFYNYGGYALNVDWSINSQPLVKNNIFVGKGGARPIVKNSSMTLDGVDYNSYDVALGYRWIDGEHSLVGKNPHFVNAPADFHLRSDSPSLSAGEDVGLASAGNRQKPDQGIYLTH